MSKKIIDLKRRRAGLIDGERFLVYLDSAFGEIPTLINAYDDMGEEITFDLLKEILQGEETEWWPELPEELAEHLTDALFRHAIQLRRRTEPE